MSRVRQQLRRAAQEFADHLYDILHDSLLAELRQGRDPDDTPAPSAPAPQARRRRAPSATSDTVLERVLVYVTEHPGTQPKDLIEATGLRREAVFAALASACAMGALVKEGSWRNVTYSPAGYTSPAAASPRRPTRRASRTTPVVEIANEVVAFVADHPGCTRAALAAALPEVAVPTLRRALDVARAERRVRMEGTRRTARYFAIAATSASSVDASTIAARVVALDS